MTDRLTDRISRVIWRAEPPHAIVVGYESGDVETYPLTRPREWAKLAAYFDRLGIERPTELVIDEETSELIEPDLIGRPRP